MKGFGHHVASDALRHAAQCVLPRGSWQAWTWMPTANDGGALVYDFDGHEYRISARDLANAAAVLRYSK